MKKDYLDLYLKYKNNHELVELIRDCEELDKYYNSYDYSPEEYEEIINERDELQNKLEKYEDIVDFIVDFKEDVEYIIDKKYIPDEDSDIIEHLKELIQEIEDL